MSSTVDICNVSLGHLGNKAIVNSIDPPDGSVEAMYCARFYPIALARLITTHEWSFATKTVPLTPVTNDSSVWGYAYAAPADMTQIYRMVIPGEMEALAQPGPATSVQIPYPNPLVAYAPTFTAALHAFELGLNDNGDNVIYCNINNALARIGVAQPDPTRFSPLFEEALTYILAALLAGPILRGKEGRETRRELSKMAEQCQQEAEANDANQRRVLNDHLPSHLAGR